MPKRFTDTEIWKEDWFISLAGEYQLFVKFIYDNCDHSGIWKANCILFQRMSGFKVCLDSLVKRVNGDKQRLVKLNNGRWFLPGFIKFQYFDKKDSFYLCLNNHLHKSIHDSLIANGIDLKTVWGLRGVKKNPKDKDQETVMEKETHPESPIMNQGKSKLEQAWDDFMKMRNKIKKPLTKQAESRIRGRLKTLAGESSELQIAILNQSVDFCWQDVYPLKKPSTQAGTNIHEKQTERLSNGSCAGERHQFTHLRY